MINFETFTTLEQLPQNISACLYGAGEFGQTIYSVLQKHRSDIRIPFLVDSFKNGEISGIKVVKPNHLIENEKDEFDWVFVTSIYTKEIVQTLKSLNVKHVAIIDPSVLQRFSLTTPNMESKIRSIRQIFNNSEHSVLYDRLIDARTNFDKKTHHPLAKHKSSLSLQYVEFSNFSVIKTALEGGIFDGLTTQTFLKLMPSDGKVYGFDPYIEIYNNSQFKVEIEKQYDADIYPYALWDKETKVRFFEDSPDPSQSIGSSRVINSMSTAKYRNIATIRIDKFVDIHNIDRVDYIKMDIEGSELEALKGAKDTITSHRPQLAICIYHKPQHLVEIPYYLSGFLTNYNYYLGHYSVDIWETVFYAIPKEIDKFS